MTGHNKRLRTPFEIIDMLHFCFLNPSRARGKIMKIHSFLTKAVITEAISALRVNVIV